MDHNDNLARKTPIQVNQHQRVFFPGRTKTKCSLLFVPCQDGAIPSLP